MGNDVEITKYIQDVAINDSEVALERLYNHYHYNLLHFSQIYVIDENDAEEIISDTFLDIWENRKKLVKLKNFNAYIYTLVRNKSISAYRSHHNNVNLESIPIDLLAQSHVTPEDILISKEKVEKINRAINSLPNKCKLAFKLVKENQLKYKEVSEILNISIKSLEAHLTTAMKKIRENIKA